MNKIWLHFTTFDITRGLILSVCSAMFIYLNYWHFSFPLIDTIFAILTLYFLLLSNQRVWFFFGVFMAILWFYWIGLSLEHYGYGWGLPVGIFLVSLGYGILFYIFAYISNFLSDKTSLPSLLFKALFLLGFSYIHPFGFDWFKPELMFVESYIGIQKW
ncbi:MAG: apolipoprotein N-acyltransferase, partial [Sulfurovum sp.]